MSGLNYFLRRMDSDALNRKFMDALNKCSEKYNSIKENYPQSLTWFKNFVTATLIMSVERMTKLEDEFEANKIQDSLMDYYADKIEERWNELQEFGIRESITRILREELSARVRRRVPSREMEKEFLESFEDAYNLTKRRKISQINFLDELINTTANMMMDGLHWRFVSTLPKNEFWYEDISTELKNHYRDRIAQMYNERKGINESVLREETEKMSPFFWRRVNIDNVRDLLKINAEQVNYETESYEQFKYELTLKAVESIMWNEYELGWEHLPEQEEIEFVTKVSNILEKDIKLLYNIYHNKK